MTTLLLRDFSSFSNVRGSGGRPMPPVSWLGRMCLITSSFSIIQKENMVSVGCCLPSKLNGNKKGSSKVSKKPGAIHIDSVCIRGVIFYILLND